MVNNDIVRSTGTARGNFVTEWFGHRVWPFVADAPEAERDQRSRRCPFLSNATREERQCIKVPRGGNEPTGLCTISSDSNKVRQDWLACPYRILDQRFTLLEEPVRTLYHVRDDEDTLILPVTALRHPHDRDRVFSAIESPSARVFAFAADKLGGEVDLPETPASPGSKVDVSIVEILAINLLSGEPSELGQHLIYEIQTADFHGTPLRAIRLLQDLCPADSAEPYHDRLAANVDICGTGVEGPNKSNIFKRTIYQMILKMEMAKHPDCAGFSIVIPAPVWQSWLRHLGDPSLGSEEVVKLSSPGEDDDLASYSRSWVFVFDIDRTSEESPQPLHIVRRIATSPEALKHYAFDLPAQKSFAAGVVTRYRETLLRRIVSNWYT